ncbi:MAG: hypothetical protein R6T83_05765 [Salinibacter sp.]
MYNHTYATIAEARGPGEPALFPGFTITTYRPVDIENPTVTIPRKENTTKGEGPVEVGPLVETALDSIDADPTTRQAAEAALEVSDGCVTLANFLVSQEEEVPTLDTRFKVPLLVLGAKLGREDDGVESVYDPAEGALYFETDDHPFSFSVYEDWTVDWEQVADRTQKGYAWGGAETDVWALDWLMAYLDVGADDYMVDSDEDDDDQYYSRI